MSNVVETLDTGLDTTPSQKKSADSDRRRVLFDERRRGIRNALKEALRAPHSHVFPRSAEPESGVILVSGAPVSNDAERTPIPDTSKRSMKRSADSGAGGGGSDGGGGNDGGPKRPESGEIEAVDLSPTMLSLQNKINNNAELGLHVETPLLSSGVEWQDGFRRQFWNPNEWEHVGEIQKMDNLGELDGYEEYYRFLAHSGTYHGGRIALENFAAMLGLESHRDIDDIYRRFVRVKKNGSSFKYEPVLLHDGQYQAANIMELGPGNGDLIRRVARYKRGSEPLKRMKRELIDSRTRLSRRLIYDMLQNGRQRLADEIDEGEIDHSISAVDYIGRFAYKLQQSKINGVKANIEASPVEFMQKMRESGIEPHSQDIIAATLLADRVDVQKLAEKIHLLARTDGMTRLFFAQTFPFERESDNDTKRENVIKIPNWESPDDIRENWTASIQVDEDFQDLGDEEAVRAQAIYNAVRDLKELGIEVYSIGEQPYEVYSAHCIVETAGTIRTEYAHLKDKKFINPELKKLIDAIFTEDQNRRIEDDKLVGIPQEYRLVMFAAHVVPLHRR